MQMFTGIKFKIYIYVLLVINLQYAQVYLPSLRKIPPGERYIPSEIVAKRITKPIKIDGYLTDEGWKEAAVDSLTWEIYPNHLAKPEVNTKMLVGYDDENLYFGFVCYEKNMKELRATKYESRKSHMFPLTDDYLDIIIYRDTVRIEDFHFAVNPLGIKSVLYVDWSIPFSEFKDILWSADTKIWDSCWTVEIGIPWRELKINGNINYLKAHILRIRPREVQYDYHWSPLPLGVDYDPTPFAGKIYLIDPLKPVQNFSFLPYFTGGMEKHETQKYDFTQRIGLTGKYYFTYANILDFTINPDYSQIETDAQKIDVNTTSAIYYEEKRPFFLEGKEIFETPFEVFYTRMINDPLFAIKFQGDVKDFKIAFLNAYERHTPWIIPFPEASFSVESDKKSISNIFRIKKNFLKGSYAGILITDRELEKSFSRTLTLDGNFIFLKYSYLTCQGIYTHTKEPDNINLSYEFDGETLYGKGFNINFRHQSPKYYLNLEWKGLSPEFRADNGFIQYNDYEKREAKGGIYFIFGEKSLIQSIFPQWGIKEIRRFLKGRYYLNKNTFINISFKNLINAGFGYEVYSRKYRGVNFRNLWNYTLSITSSTLKNFYLSSYVIYGREINYYSYPLTSGYLLYPSLDLNLNIWNLRFKSGYSRYMMWDKNYKERIYNQEVLNSEIAYLFSRFTAFRIINQYNSGTGEYFIYPLFSFEPTPFTLFYLGSNHTIIKEDGKYKQKDFRIFIKIQYQLRL